MYITYKPNVRVCVYSENCGVRLIVEGVIWYSILAPIPSLSPLALMVMVTVCTYLPTY